MAEHPKPCTVGDSIRRSLSHRSYQATVGLGLAAVIMGALLSAIPAPLHLRHSSPALTDPIGGRAQSVTVASPARGVLRKSAANPYRLVNADGSLFVGAGLNACWYRQPDGTIAAPSYGGVDTPAFPAGRSSPWLISYLSPDDYFRRYAAAGFNLFRLNPGNCNDFPHVTDPTQARYIDVILQSAYAQGFHIIYTFFYDAPTDVLPAMQTIDYSMQRWGQYVDIWEIGNEDTESSLPTPTLEALVSHVRSIDPAGRLVTNSYPRAGVASYLDARSPHRYQDVVSDADLVQNTTDDFTNGDPVIIGEAGNNTTAQTKYSDVQIRTRTWTAFIYGGVELWWDSTCCPSYANAAANMYIGAEEQAYIRIFSMVANGFDVALKAAPNESQSVGSAHLIVARSDAMYVGYLYRANGLGSGSDTLSVSLPYAGSGEWIDPSTGQALGTFSVTPGEVDLKTPPYTDDLLLLVKNGDPAAVGISPYSHHPVRL